MSALQAWMAPPWDLPTALWDVWIGWFFVVERERDHPASVDTLTRTAAGLRGASAGVVHDARDLAVARFHYVIEGVFVARTGTG